MDQIKKLNKKLHSLKEKRKHIVTTLQICREAVRSNMITPHQRKVMQQVLSPILKGIEEKSKELRLTINDQYIKEK